MDRNLRYTINYAQQELKEIVKLSNEGKLTDKGAFVRLFFLGKVLTGWDDEGTEFEQYGRLMTTNRRVMEILNQVTIMRA